MLATTRLCHGRGRPVVLVVALAIAACRSPTPTSPSATPPSVSAPTASAPTCPIEYLHAAPPAVRTFASLAAAKTALMAGATPSPDEDLIAEAAEHGSAFGTSILQRAYAGSTRIHRRHAVFVQGTRVIVLVRLGDVQTSIPPRCAPAQPDDVVSAHIVTSRRYPHLGHVRYRRAYVTDAPTLPAVAVTSNDPQCPSHPTRFRIEDHFVDLDTGEYIVGFGQVYDGPNSAASSPAIPVEQLVAGAAGITAPGCDELRWPYPEGE